MHLLLKSFASGSIVAIANMKRGRPHALLSDVRLGHGRPLHDKHGRDSQQR